MCGLHVRVIQFSSLFEVNLLRAELNLNLLILSRRRGDDRQLRTTQRASTGQCFRCWLHMNDVCYT